MNSVAREHIHFVTGRLAQHALQKLVPQLAQEVGFDYSVDVLPITVAALMSPAWIAKHISVPPAATRVLLPGYCDGNLEPLAETTEVPLEVGPRDLGQLPAFFSREPVAANYGKYDIEIIAEINHCPRLSRAEILRQAVALGRAGADWIDVGCEPGEPWGAVDDVVRALRDAGHRVSIDSMNPREIEPAVRAGAELVLSVNSSNCTAALDWGVEVVVVPDDPETLAGLDDTVGCGNLRIGDAAGKRAALCMDKLVVQQSQCLGRNGRHVALSAGQRRVTVVKDRQKRWQQRTLQIRINAAPLLFFRG